MRSRLQAIIASGTISVLFIAFSFRVLMLGTEDPAFWVLPLGVMITLTTAPIFSGIAYYLGVSLCVWAILGLGQFPVHAGQADQHWPVLAVTISVIIGLALNIYFLVLRIHNYRAQRELATMAYKDGLTGLNNRRMFTQSARALQRTARTPAYFLMIDIDDFKQINDMYGHDVGDEVLKKIADVIAEAIGRAPVRPPGRRRVCRHLPGRKERGLRLCRATGRQRRGGFRAGTQGVRQHRHRGTDQGSRLVAQLPACR